jgi:hypothetical protein
MSLFSHQISFQPIDPLGDGLREEIAAEQQEPEALISLEEGLSEGQLSEYWQSVVQDVENDPEWFHFSED